MEATKRPWKITEYTNYRGFAIESESDPAFGCIAERWENMADNSRRAAMEANARLIVKAVNLHDDLAEGLNEIRDRLTAWRDTANMIYQQNGSEDAYNQRGNYDGLVSKIDALFQRAKEE